jgi:hypothetical protein
MSKEIDIIAKALWDNYQSQPYVQYGIYNRYVFGKQDGEKVTWEELMVPNVVPYIANEYREMARAALRAIRELPEGKRW